MLRALRLNVPFTSNNVGRVMQHIPSQAYAEWAPKLLMAFSKSKFIHNNRYNDALVVGGRFVLHVSDVKLSLFYRPFSALACKYVFTLFVIANVMDLVSEFDRFHDCLDNIAREVSVVSQLISSYRRSLPVCTPQSSHQVGPESGYLYG